VSPKGDGVHRPLRGVSGSRERAVFPGRAYRITMRALPRLPRELARRQAARSAARLRNTVKGAASAPDRPGGEVRA
jgi:hypothetical protein